MKLGVKLYMQYDWPYERLHTKSLLTTVLIHFLAKNICTTLWFLAYGVLLWLRAETARPLLSAAAAKAN